MVDLLFNKKGSATIYALFFTPFVFTTAILGIEVARWNQWSDTLQQEADRITLHAVKFLPDREKVVQYIAQETNKLSGVTDIPEGRNISSSSVQITLRTEFESVFDSFLEEFGAEGKTFRVTKTSTAQVVPMDIVLIVSDGASLAPELGTPSWGEERDWPPSSYFTKCAAPTKEHSEEDELAPDWTDPEVQRFATQRCFNPALSPLKLGIISLLDSITATRTHRVSLLLTPGGDTARGVRVLRHLREEQKVGGQTFFSHQIGGFLDAQDGTAQSHWFPLIQSSTTPLNNAGCVILSHKEAGIDRNYELPSPPAMLPLRNTEVFPQDALRFPLCGRRVSLRTPELNTEYFENTLRLREALYWHAIQSSDAHYGGIPNIQNALEEATSQITNIGSQEILNREAKNIRGNLGHRALQKIIVISDTLPDVSNLSFLNLMKQGEQLGIQYVFVAYLHPGLTLPQQIVLQATARSLRDMRGEENSHIRVFLSRSPEEFQRKIIPRLYVLGRKIAIRS